MSLEYLQERWFNHFPGQLVPACGHYFREEIFPNIQLEPPLAQTEVFLFSPITTYVGEEAKLFLTTTSFKGVAEMYNVSLEPLLQTKQYQFFQPHLIRLVLQTPHQLHCPSLNMLHGLDVFLVARGPKLNTALEMWPQHNWVLGDNHLPAPTGNTISDTSQDTTGLLGYPANCWQHPQVHLSCHSDPSL